MELGKNESNQSLTKMKFKWLQLSPESHVNRSEADVSLDGDGVARGKSVSLLPGKELKIYQVSGSEGGGQSHVEMTSHYFSLIYICYSHIPALWVQLRWGGKSNNTSGNIQFCRSAFCSVKICPWNRDANASVPFRVINPLLTTRSSSPWVRRGGSMWPPWNAPLQLPAERPGKKPPTRYTQLLKTTYKSRLCNLPWSTHTLTGAFYSNWFNYDRECKCAAAGWVTPSLNSLTCPIPGLRFWAVKPLNELVKIIISASWRPLTWLCLRGCFKRPHMADNDKNKQAVSQRRICLV